MINNLSKDLRQSKILNEILRVDGLEFEDRDLFLNELHKQMTISTATWGLSIYEEELNIETDIYKDIEERRSIIKSKWRSSGKVDAVLIKLVAGAWANGDCEVTFDGRIIIKFNGIYGTLSNLTDLEKALENIKPAHLRILYEFAYLLIRDIHDITTISEIERTTLSKFAGGATNG